MALKKKHIAPYFPWEVQFKEGEQEPKIISALYDNSLACPTDFSPRRFDRVKLILYPLSDLVKFKDEILIRWGGGLVSDKAKLNWLNKMINNMTNSAYVSLRYDEMEFMFEKRIDILNLISQGLAVDVNTLKVNPYK